MKKLGSMLKAREDNRPSPPPLPDSEPIREAPGAPSAKSWKVDEALLEETSRLVPASPDDVSEETRAVLYAMVFSKPEAWVNLDHVEFGLGVALDLFPQEATFETLKWVFWTDNALNKKLSNLVQALARPESECLESRTQPDFQFRRAVLPID
ncbi:hypothetical protein BASA81_001724 [Batrachochytrium salamandrivorans]|nr:hypothetical protein BASA81_001724 [Batrachochytrium salamandrivorans]